MENSVEQLIERIIRRFSASKVGKAIGENVMSMPCRSAKMSAPLM